MSEFLDFKKVHFDVLKELGNIGAGNAVTALSKMLNKKIDMHVPVVNIVEFKDIATFLGGEENLIIGILVYVSGDINGMMMFIIRHDSARILLDTLLSRESTDPFLFTEMELSALNEVGNILASSYLGSLSTLIQKKMNPSVPYLAIDMANAILSVPAIEFSKIADRVLFIESVFEVKEEEDVSGYFILVPELTSFDLMLSSLGV